MGVIGPHPAATRLTTDDARAGRSEGERRAVADPERLRVRVAAALRELGPDAAAFMRRGFENSYAAYTRRDWEVNTLLIDRYDYEFRAGELREALPGARELYRGADGYLELHGIFLEAWPDLRVELADVLRIERDRVITLMRFAGHGGRSAIPLDWLTVGDNRFRDGVTVSQVYWWDPGRAAEALGLPADAIAR